MDGHPKARETAIISYRIESPGRLLGVADDSLPMKRLYEVPASINPESVLKILHHFAISPTEALFVGDSVVDQESAQGAQVTFVAYKSSALQADYYIDDLLAVKDIIIQKPEAE